MKKIFPVVVVVCALSFAGIFYTNGVLTDLNRKLYSEKKSCINDYLRKENAKRAELGEEKIYSISYIINEEIEKKCLSGTKADFFFHLRNSISKHDSILDLLRVTLVLSSILTLFCILKNAKNIFIIATKTILQRIGFIIFILSLCFLFYEIDTMRYPKKYPIISLSMFAISIGLFTNIFKRIYEWIKKGS